MWSPVLIPASGCFTQNRNSETNTTLGKGDYTVVK